jgi:lipopolysaccharide export system permease protein
MMYGLMARYIGKSMVSVILIILLCFVMLTTLFSLVEELSVEAIGYGTREALLYIFYSSPRRIYELVPYVVFLGSLIGLGVLSSNSEVTVLRSAGVSLGRIFLMVAIPVVGISFLNSGIGEYLAPRFDAKAEMLRTKAMQNSDTIDLGGYWYREGGRFMHVEGLGTLGELVGVSQFEVDEAKHLRYARHADSASFDQASGVWRLYNVRSTRLKENIAVSEQLDEVLWQSQAEPRLLSAQALIEPRKLSIADLYYQIRYMEREGLQAARYRLALWGKLLQPLAILGLVLIAMGFVVGPLREVSMGTRLAVGITVGLSFKYLQDLFAPASLVFAIPAWVAVLIPIVACWGAGWLFVKRAA